MTKPDRLKARTFAAQEDIEVRGPLWNAEERQEALPLGVSPFAALVARGVVVFESGKLALTRVSFLQSWAHLLHHQAAGKDSPKLAFGFDRLGHKEAKGGLIAEGGRSRTKRRRPL